MDIQTGVWCVYCRHEIPPDVQQCPHCRRLMSNGTRVIKCRSCGSYILKSDIRCKRCGVASEYVKRSSALKSLISERAKYMLAVVAVLMIIPLSIFAYSKYRNAAQRNDYISDLLSAKTYMAFTASVAEDAANLTHDVWYNTIYEKENAATDPFTMHDIGTKFHFWVFNDDFNDSLHALYVSDKYQSYIEVINECDKEIAEYYARLQNPPKDLAFAYSILDNMYDEYQSLVNCAVNPSGNLNSYTQNLNNARDNFAKYYKKLEAAVPEANIEKLTEDLLARIEAEKS